MHKVPKTVAMIRWKQTVAITIIAVMIASLALIQLPTIKAATTKTVIVPDIYSTIQEAINNAHSGDTILVRSGIYNQTLHIDKSISLIGQNAKTTILTVPITYGPDFVEKRYEHHPPVIAVEIKADNAKISGFTVKNDNKIGIGIESNGTSNQITNICMDSIGGGITIRGSNQTLYHNSVTNAIAGSIDCEGSYNQIIDNQIVKGGLFVFGQFNTITENRVTNDSVIYPGDSGLICNNTFSESTMYLLYNSNIIYKNTLQRCVFDFGDGSRVATNNFVVANTIDQLSGPGWGLFVVNGLNNTFFGNIIANGGYGLTLTQHARGNLFYYNMFANNSENFWTYEEVDSNSFDNGTVGNYWSNYLAKYPNAKMVGNSGVGNTPYTVYGSVSDNHPLMAPFDVSTVNIQLPYWSNLTKPILISTEDLFSANATPSVPESFWFAILPLLITLFSVALIFRHRRQVKKV